MNLAFALAPFAAALVLASLPSGEIAFTRGGDVFVVADGGGEALSLVGDLEYDRPIAWSPDGATLLYWKHDAGWNIWAVDAAGIRHENLTKQNGGDCRSAAFSPDGSTIAYLRGDPPGVYAMARDGSAQRLVVGKGHRDQPPSFSPDGARLVYMDIEPLDEKTVRTTLRVAFVDGRGDRLLANGSDSQWSPDGKSIVFVGQGKSGLDLFSVSETGGAPAPVAASPEDESEPRLSPDGRLIAFNASATDGKTELRVADLAAGEPAPARRLASIEGRAEPPSFSPDGKRLAFVSGGALFVADVSGGAPRKIAEGGVHWPAWRPAR